MGSYTSHTPQVLPRTRRQRKTSRRLLNWHKCLNGRPVFKLLSSLVYMTSGPRLSPSLSMYLPCATDFPARSFPYSASHLNAPNRCQSPSPSSCQRSIPVPPRVGSVRFKNIRTLLLCFLVFLCLEPCVVLAYNLSFSSVRPALKLPTPGACCTTSISIRILRMLS